MRLIPLQQTLRAVAAPGCRTTTAAAAFTFSRAQRRPELSPWRVDDGGRLVEGRRNAAVKSQGAYKIPNKKTIPKKLGAKKSGDQFVIPGNIIYKQRGTIWHPGENTIMGRDHTIHAAVSGYVKYYRDPARHPTRQFIGVAFERDDVLPYPAHGVRRRKLSMVAVTRREPAPMPTSSPSGLPTRIIRKEGVAPPTLPVVAAAASSSEDGEVTAAAPTMRAAKRFAKGRARVLHEISIRRNNRVLLLQKDYSYRESNAAIGRLMGRHKGKTPGTVRVGSVKAAYRARRRARAEETKMLREAREQEAAQRKKEAEKAAARAAARAQKAAEAAAKAEAKAKAKAEKAAAARDAPKMDA